MKDTDILLSIDLDTKDALQTAKGLKKEIERDLGKNNTAKGVEIDIKSKEALAQMDEVIKKIDEINAHPVQLDVKTEEFQAVEKELDTIREKQQEFMSQGYNSALIETMNSQYENSLTALEVLPKEIEEQKKAIESMKPIETKKGNVTYVDYSNITEAKKELEEMTAELEKQKQVQESVLNNPLYQQYLAMEQEENRLIQEKSALISQGKQFQMGGDPKQLEEANKQLDKINDKVKLLAVKKRELTKPSGGGAGTGGADSLGFAGSIAALSTGAGKALTIVQKLGKTLKKGLLTVAAIMLGVRGVMGIIRRIRRMIIDGFKEVVAGDDALKKKTDEIKKSWEEVKVNLTAAFLPIIELAIPYLQQLLNWINLIISKLAMFIALIAGQNAYTKAIKKTGDAAKSASKQLSKFDELNNLSSGGGDSGSNFDFEKVPIDDKFVAQIEKLKALLEEIKERFKELMAIPFLEGFFGSLGDWQGKIDTIKENIKSIGASLISIFTNPDLIAAQEKYIKSFSRAFGAITGLAANIGLNIGEALTGGIADFLENHKEEISNDLTEMFTIASGVFDNITQLATDLSSIVDTIGESEALKGTISNLLGVVYELYMAIELVLLKLLELSSGTIAELIHNNVENIKKTLEGLFQVLEKVAGFLQAVATTIRNILIRLVEDVITPLLEPVKYVIQQLLDAIFALWDQLQPVLLWLMDEITALWTDYVDPVLNDIIDLVNAVAELIMPIIKSIWDNAIQPVIDLIMKWMPFILSTVKITFDAIIFIIKTLMIILGALIKAITDVVRFVTAIIKGDWKTAWEMCLKFVKDLFVDPAVKIWGAFTKYFEDVIDHYLELLKNLVKGVVGTGEVIVNALVNLINEGLLRIVNGATSALNLIPGVDIPQVPEIPHVSWTVPGLAQGAVIPPSMGEFIAKLGDNNRETEIVSPLSTMKEALLEALKESGGTGGEIHIHVDLEGREIAKAVVKQNEIYRRSTGRTLFA